MKELKGHDVETLLEQVGLIHPPETLDDSIGELFQQPPPNRNMLIRRFGFVELCAAAAVALLVGGAIGFSAAQFKPVVAKLSGNIDAAALFTPVVFNKLHGHSNSTEFADCSACHKFENKQQQQWKKWRMETFHDPEIREQLGVPDCRNCHTPDGNLGPSPHPKSPKLD